MTTEHIKQAEIDELPFPDCVRLRKGMYLPKKNYLVYEIVDNSVDEHLAKDNNGVPYCQTIYLKIEEDGQIYVQDDGRGIPILPSKKDPTKTMAEIAYTKLHAGGKFGKEGGYNVKTGGLNGVGASCCNATSIFCNLYPIIDGVQYLIGFEKGVTTTPLTEVGPVGEGEPTHGTLVHLKPDDEVWCDEMDEFDIPEINNRMKQLAYLNAGLNIIVDINYGGHVINEHYYYPDGLKAYVEELTKKKTPLTEILGCSDTIKGVDVEISLVWTDAYDDEIYTFVNNIPTTLGGSHLTGLKEGIFGPIKEAYEESPESKTKADVSSDDARDGLVAVLSVQVADPNFDGQGKAKLQMSKVRNAVKNVINVYLEDVLDKNPDMKKIIISKMLASYRAREAAKKARDTSRQTKSLLDSTGLPGKLAACSVKDPEECEIFFVEGDSAAGTAKQGRDRKIQAILPVFGKISNVEKTRLAKVLSSVKIREVIKALECGIGEEFDLERLRYHKIIIMADADVDGSHIQTLWITFFYRFLKPIIDEGYLYLACPPLYKITKNKKVHYAYTDAHLEKILSEIGNTGIELQRYKGLGEMNDTQLWDTTMNPETRMLQQIVVTDEADAENAIVTCMGEEVAPRKEFIISRAALEKQAQYMDEEYVPVEEM